jgi:hypothetical protein
MSAIGAADASAVEWYWLAALRSDIRHAAWSGVPATVPSTV